MTDFGKIFIYTGLVAISYALFFILIIYEGSLNPINVWVEPLRGMAIICAYIFIALGYRLRVKTRKRLPDYVSKIVSKGPKQKYVGIIFLTALALVFFVVSIFDMEDSGFSNFLLAFMFAIPIWLFGVAVLYFIAAYKDGKHPDTYET